MSEMSFEQMLEESLKSVHAGEIVTGTVITPLHSSLATERDSISKKKKKKKKKCKRGPWARIGGQLTY